MKRFTRSKTSLFVFTFTLVLAVQSTAAAPPLPNPVLIFTGQEEAVVGGKQIIRYHYDVFNKDEYPKDFFAASPKLPPCGKNTMVAISTAPKTIIS